MKEAWDEEIYHEAETHEVVETIVDKEAWTETKYHEAKTHEEEVTVIVKAAYEETIAARSDSKENLTIQERDAELSRYVKELGYSENETHWEKTKTDSISTDWVMGATKDELEAARAKLISEGYNIGLTEDDIYQTVDVWSKITYGGSLDGSTRASDKEIGDCCYNYISLNDCKLTCHNRGTVLSGGTVTTTNIIDGGVQEMSEAEKITFLEYWTAIGMSKAVVITDSDIQSLTWNMNQHNSNHTESGVNIDPNMPVYYYDGEGTIKWNGIWGVLIAPKASVVMDNGNAVGTVVADNIQSATEYHLWAWSKNEEKGESYALIGKKDVDLYKVWASSEEKTVKHPEVTGKKTITVVDQEAWTETINHPAETHNETRTVVDKEAYTEVIKHPAETEIVSEEKVVKPAWTEEIHHEEESHYETVTVVDKEPWTEYKEHDPITHEETVAVIDIEAHKEYIHHDAETHTEPDVKTVEELFGSEVWGKLLVDPIIPREDPFEDVPKDPGEDPDNPGETPGNPTDPKEDPKEDPKTPTDPKEDPKTPTDPGENPSTPADPGENPSTPADPGENPNTPENPDEDVLGKEYDNPDEDGAVLGESFVKTGDTKKARIVFSIVLMVSGGILGVLSVTYKKIKEENN